MARRAAEKTMAQKIATYLELKAKMEQLKKDVADAEMAIKAGMEVAGVTEVSENGFVARIETGTQRRFDTTKFKAAYPDVYESYRKDVSTTSFKAYVVQE